MTSNQKKRRRQPAFDNLEGRDYTAGNVLAGLAVGQAPAAAAIHRHHDHGAHDHVPQRPGQAAAGVALRRFHRQFGAQAGAATRPGLIPAVIALDPAASDGVKVKSALPERPFDPNLHYNHQWRGTKYLFYQHSPPGQRLHFHFWIINRPGINDRFYTHLVN